MNNSGLDHAHGHTTGGRADTGRVGQLLGAGAQRPGNSRRLERATGRHHRARGRYQGIVLNPNPPVVGYPATITVNGTYFDPAAAQILLTGPGCSPCTISNAQLTTKTATSLVASRTFQIPVPSRWRCRTARFLPRRPRTSSSPLPPFLRAARAVVRTQRSQDTGDSMRRPEPVQPTSGATAARTRSRCAAPARPSLPMEATMC